jgi:AcrR family transcriptional regulator
MARSKLEKAQNRRAEILNVAMDVFAEKGYFNASISDITGQVKIGQGTFYRYFKGKLDIFNSVIEQLIADITAVVIQEAPTSSNNLDEYRSQLARLGKRLHILFIRQDRMGKIVFYESMGVDPIIKENISQAMNLFTSFTRQYLVNGVNKGFLREDLDTEISAKIIISMLFEGIAQMVRSSNKAESSRRWMHEMLEIIVDGRGN